MSELIGDDLGFDACGYLGVVALRLGPEISSFLRDPNAALERWEDIVTNNRWRLGNPVTIAPYSPLHKDLQTSHHDVRYVVNAFVARKTIDVFCANYDPRSVVLPRLRRFVPDSLTLRRTRSPYAAVEQGIEQLVVESAADARLLMRQSRIERRLLRLSDYLTSMFMFRSASESRSTFEGPVAKTGGGTGIDFGVALHARIPEFWALDDRSAGPADFEETARASHQLIKAMAAMDGFSFHWENHRILPAAGGYTQPPLRDLLLHLDVPDSNGVRKLALTPEGQRFAAEHRAEWITPTDAVVPHMSCVALAPFPNLLGEWQGAGGPLSAAIDEQLDWLTSFWVANDLWNPARIAEVAAESNRWRTETGSATANRLFQAQCFGARVAAATRVSLGIGIR